ncbi:hypothetical protein [Mycolicibacter virginiensis]|uniref:hypothetical protein n=1 Tax=Mycolicibacter virginiensis TaxID=1795032 RepID=UPI001F043C0A|nr:hypothetical protein [Mycolicibacter virginiensis]ULP48028.1 hypothetical protein MJO54_02330 [Mycolicibacter virginiensis]
MKLALALTGVLAAAALLGAPPAVADARQDFLDQYHAAGAHQTFSDDQLVYVAESYCVQKSRNAGAWWYGQPWTPKFSPSAVAHIADQTLCP